MLSGGRRDFVKTAIQACGGIVTSTALHSKGLVDSGLNALVTRQILHEAQNERVWACWIGQSSVLIKLGNTWVLTDPVFADVVGLNILGVRIGPRRILPPAIALHELPKPDLILLSHAHMDHMDRWTLENIAERWPNEISVLTASNTRDVIMDLPWLSCEEIDWGETTTLRGLSVRALQVQHNGWRLPGERCRSNGFRRTGRSYNGYEIEFEGIRIVFGGDTAFTNEFKTISREVDLAIMPIGSYEGYAAYHCNPEEAVAMANMMKARSIMPIHHLTFRQSSEPVREPLARLIKAIDGGSVHIAARLPGSTYRYTA